MITNLMLPLQMGGKAKLLFIVEKEFLKATFYLANNSMFII
ncbi:hypothetical protein [Mucilaginibacter phyllosphaerae]|uniref:Uncharacterized protein n=1 Tax=Mucilaginibacter phyllosphaerae TaxID=1812349 RepID=A0ABR6I8J9_9SPHI|nr:hypothetical protein [Mucilaginibacter phyllosphaerae]MBB3969342.1 hypothetical protein [Mucilaginibacter phyllosphaerae]